MDEQTKILLQKFMDKIWPEYSSQLYSDLYRTYHPSTYVEGRTNPKGNFELALDTIGEAIQKGKSYGLLPGGQDWEIPFSKSIKPPNLGYAPSLGILEGDDNYLGTRTTWLIAVLLWDRLYDIVEEFRCYCGENGIDPDCKGKCIGEFPYLYEDYNKLHDYMVKLNKSEAPLDIMLNRSDTLNKIQLSPERDYIPTEHPHAAFAIHTPGGELNENIDKFLSRRLSVIKENIYNLSDGELLGESEQHQLENQMTELFNIHKHEASEHLFKWSIKDVISETNIHTELNPELEEGDKVIVVNKKDIQSGYRDYMGEQEPELYERYVVIEKRYSGHKAKDPYHYFLLPDIPKYQNIKLYTATDMNPEDYNDVKALFPWISEWIHAKDKKKQELNPDLEEGDYVKIISVDGQHANMPEKWEVYKVNSVNQDLATHRMYYGLYPTDQTDDKLLSSMLAGGGKQRELYLYFGDEWIKADPPSQLNEEVNSELNPELEVGDLIRVLEIGQKRDFAPEKWKPYEVTKLFWGGAGGIDDGSREEVLYYQVVTPGEKAPFSDPTEPPNIKKIFTLRPHHDTWQKIDEPKKNYENPDIKPGDIVIPIDIDKSDGTMHTPDLYKRYKVISGLQVEDGGEIYYYEIEPVDLSDDDRLSGMLVGGGSRRNERLYPDHDLYKLAKEQKERTYLDKLEGMELEYDPEKANTGGVREFTWVDEETGTSTDTLLFDIDYIRTAPILTYGDGEPEENELVKFDLILKGDKSGLFNDWFDLDDRETRKKLIDYSNTWGRKSVLLNYFYDNYLKLYGIKKEHLRLENVLIPDSDGIVRNVSGGQQLSEGILDTFKVISDLNKGIITN